MISDFDPLLGLIVVFHCVLDKVLEEFPQKWIVIPAAQSGSTYPYFPFFTEANDAIGVELERIMLGEKGVEQGLADAEVAVKDVIERRTA